MSEWPTTMTHQSERGAVSLSLFSAIGGAILRHKVAVTGSLLVGTMMVAGGLDGAGRDPLVIGSVEESTTVAHAELRKLAVKQEFCVAEAEVDVTVGKRILGKPFGYDLGTNIPGVTLNLDRSVVYHSTKTVKFCFDGKEVEYTYDPNVSLMRDRKTDAEKADPRRRVSITVPDATETNSAMHIYVVGSRESDMNAYKWTSNGLPAWYTDFYKNVFQQSLVQAALTENNAQNLNVGEQVDSLLATGAESGGDEIAAQACTGDSTNATMLSAPIEKVLDDGLAEKAAGDVANIDKIVVDREDVEVKIGKQNVTLADEMQTRLKNQSGALSSLDKQQITIGPVKIGPVDLGSLQLALDVKDTDDTMKNATCTIAPSASILIDQEKK